jgi:hypothetical protein
MSRNTGKLTLFLGLALVFSGCNGGGYNGGRENPPNGGTTRPDPKRPDFLIYASTSRKVLKDALGNRKVVRVKQQVKVSRTALRFDDPSGDSSNIIRLDRKVVWRLDHKKRTYMQGTFAQHAAQVEGVKKLLAGQLGNKKLSAAERRSIEIAIGRRQPKVTEKVDPQSVQLLGRKCRHISYYEDGKLRIEEWIADDVVLPCDLTELRSLTGDFSRDLLERLKAHRGLALKLRVLGRLPTSPRMEERTVTRVELPARLDAGLFELPADYTRAR